jgi:hypothetical protein
LLKVRNIRWVETIERLLERENLFEGAALIQLCFENRNTLTDQAVLNVRQAARADHWVRTRQQHSVRFCLARHLGTLKHDADRPARLIRIELRALCRNNHEIRLRNGVHDSFRCGAFQIHDDERRFCGGVFDPFNDCVFVGVGHDRQSRWRVTPTRPGFDGMIGVGIYKSDSIDFGQGCGQ